MGTHISGLDTIIRVPDLLDFYVETSQWEQFPLVFLQHFSRDLFIGDHLLGKEHGSRFSLQDPLEQLLPVL